MVTIPSVSRARRERYARAGRRPGVRAAPTPKEEKVSVGVVKVGETYRDVKTGKRIPRRVALGFDVVDPKTGSTVRAETLSTEELKSYYKETGVTPPSNILQRFVQEQRLY